MPIDSLDSVQKELLRICHFIQPDYFPVTQVAVVQDEHILAIWCPPGQHRPYKAPKTLGKKDAINKPYYIRKMSSTVEAGRADEQRLLELAVNNRTPFDNQVNYHVSIDEINLLHVMAFLDIVKSD